MWPGRLILPHGRNNEGPNSVCQEAEAVTLVQPQNLTCANGATRAKPVAMPEEPSPPPRSPFVARLMHAIAALGLNEWQVEQALGRVMGAEKPKRGYLTKVIQENRSPLISTAEALADAMGVRRAWLLVGDGPMLATTATTCAEIPGWAEAAVEVRRARRVPSAAIDAVARRPAMVVPEKATAEFVRDAAYLWWHHAPDSEIEAATETEAHRVAGGEDHAPGRSSKP